MVHRYKCAETGTRQKDFISGTSEKRLKRPDLGKKSGSNAFLKCKIAAIFTNYNDEASILNVW